MNDSNGSVRLGMGIKGRLFLSFASLILSLLIMLFFIIGRVSTVEYIAEGIINTGLPTFSNTVPLDTQIFEAQTHLEMFLLTADEAEKVKFGYAWDDLNTYKSNLDALETNWKERGYGAYENQYLSLKPYFADLYKTQTQVLSLPKGTDPIPYLKKTMETYEAMAGIVDGLRSSPAHKREGGMVSSLIDIFQDSAINLLGNVTMVKVLAYSLAILMIVLAIIVSFWSVHSISLPLNKAINIAERIANGERNIDIAVTTTDETGMLLKALAKMLASIKVSEEQIRKSEEKTRNLLDSLEKRADIFGKHTSSLANGDLRQRLDVSNDDTVLAALGKDLNLMSDSMATTTRKVTELGYSMVTRLDEVKTAASAQSTGVTEQAASINEITSSIEEIDKSSKQTMEKAKSLGKVAKETREKGNLGIQSVEQSMVGMRSVRDKVQAIAQTILDLSNLTQQVGEITAVVNTLAQQSKMLALNASIEAAKAGEAGKGFAVVAIEVKNLAEQSEQSTSQVQKILEDIRHGAEKAVMVTEAGTKEVDQGTLLIEKASEVIHDLNNMIQEAAIASQQIEASIRQESISIEQISAGMGEINQVTNSFVDSVKTTMTSIEFLAKIAQDLKEQINIYKL